MDTLPVSHPKAPVKRSTGVDAKLGFAVHSLKQNPGIKNY